MREVVGRLSSRQKVAWAGSAAVVVLAVVALVVATALASPKKATARHRDPSRAQVVASSIPHTTTHLCPLTGQPAPGNVVPARPAIGIKIGNDPTSRPQTGLEHADIVYEEMAEGGITRYLAVFQCHPASAIGPVRSVRWDDWHVLASYGHPVLAFSGGIDQWNRVVAGLGWLYDANATFYPAANAYYRTSNRVPPWNLYTSTAALWKLDPHETTPPPPQFSYRASLPSGFKPVAGVTIDGFAAGSNVVWRWDSSTGAFERYYDTVPDRDSSGVQLQAKNVVIQVVRTLPGPYAESGSIPDTDSITEGSGAAYVLRDGRYVKAVWRTPSYGDPMGLYMANGSKIALAPGNTWVEMVPTGYSIQVAP